MSEGSAPLTARRVSLIAEADPGLRHPPDVPQRPARRLTVRRRHAGRVAKAGRTGPAVLRKTVGGEPKAARTLPRLLAIEVLLAEPEALQDDVLESCLYILRDRLKGVDGDRS